MLAVGARCYPVEQLFLDDLPELRPGRDSNDMHCFTSYENKPLIYIL